MLKVLGLMLVFIALAVVSIATISSLNSLDAEINETELSEPMSAAYNFSTSTTQTGFSMFGGALIFIGIGIFVAAVSIALASLRLR
jgi:hypothetical protein